MTRLRGFGIAAAIAFTVLGSSASADFPPRARSAAHARLLVSAREFSFGLSRKRLRPGRATIQLFNAGEDPHDLRLRRAGTTKVVAIAETQPGGVTQIKTVLHSGTWKLWCSLPGHARRGMRATLIVKR